MPTRIERRSPNDTRLAQLEGLKRAGQAVVLMGTGPGAHAMPGNCVLQALAGIRSRPQLFDVDDDGNLTVLLYLKA